MLRQRDATRAAHHRFARVSNRRYGFGASAGDGAGPVAECETASLGGVSAEHRRRSDTPHNSTVELGEVTHVDLNVLGLTDGRIEEVEPAAPQIPRQVGLGFYPSPSTPVTHGG